MNCSAHSSKLMAARAAFLAVTGSMPALLACLRGLLPRLSKAHKIKRAQPHPAVLVTVDPGCGATAALALLHPEIASSAIEMQAGCLRSLVTPFAVSLPTGFDSPHLAKNPSPGASPRVGRGSRRTWAHGSEQRRAAPTSYFAICIRTLRAMAGTSEQLRPEATSGATGG